VRRNAGLDFRLPVFPCFELVTSVHRFAFSALPATSPITNLITNHLSPLTHSPFPPLTGLAMESQKFYHRRLKEVDGNPKRTPL
jgi:hypothetical protein